MSSLNQKCASSICLSLLFISYFSSRYDGPSTKVFDIIYTQILKEEKALIPMIPRPE